MLSRMGDARAIPPLAALGGKGWIAAPRGKRWGVRHEAAMALGEIQRSLITRAARLGLS